MLKFLVWTTSLWAIALLPGSQSLSETDNRLYEQANQAYQEGNFDQAAELYEQLAENYPAHAAFEYNLANSYYRLGKTGRAILHYERALVDDPRHEDSRSNLNYVNSMLEYRIADERNWYIRAGERVLKWFREKELFALVLLFYFFLMSGWVFSLFFQPGEPWRWKRKTIAVLLVIAFGLFGAKQFETRIFRDAIVLVQEAEVRFGPSESDQTAFRIGEGVKVYVLDHRNEWSRIALANGKGGWMRQNQLEEVREAK